MSLWATLFLEMWKRKQKVVQWEWDLQSIEQDEEPRPGKVYRNSHLINNISLIRIINFLRI